MKILSTGDLHCDESSRFSEWKRVVGGWFVEQVRKEKPDFVAIPGDLYDRRSVPVERQAMAEMLVACADVCPVGIAKGNHDVPVDLEILARLKAKHPILVQEGAGIWHLNGMRIAAVAWPDRASIAAMLGRPLPPDAIDDVAREAMRSVLLGLGQEEPHILMMHAMVDGSKMSAGQPARWGMELNMPLSDLGRARAQLSLFSHIHLGQDWTWNDRPMVMIGSPFANDFGETEEKSIVIADVNDHGCEWSRIVTPARKMVLLEMDYVPGTESPTTSWQGSPEGSEFRLRYTFDSDQRDAAKAAAQQMKDLLEGYGAAYVKLDPVARATTRSRVPEISAATSLEDKVFAWADAKAMVIEDSRRARLSAKIGELEEDGAS